MIAVHCEAEFGWVVTPRSGPDTTRMSLREWLFGRRSPPPAAPVPPAERKAETEPGPDQKLDDPLSDQLDAELEAALSGGPHRPLLYALQYIALPAAAFGNHPELLADLEVWSDLPLAHFWSKALIDCVGAGWMPPESLDSPATRALVVEWAASMRINLHRRIGHTLHAITMPAPERSPEAYVVGILHKDDEPRRAGEASPSTRYFTLESSDGSRPFLCELARDGSHRNFGPADIANPTAFVDAVFALVARG